MMRLALATILLIFELGAVPAIAQERETLGFGRLFTNDYFGDGLDRWRSGSYSFSVIRGQDWDGALPERFGALLEYRLRSEIIAPRRLNGAGSDDRPYVGAATLGLHSHFARGAAEISAGLDLTVTGPQTGIGAMQEWFHEVIDAPRPAVLEDQIDNAVYPTATVAITRPYAIAENLTLRPYIEAQIGVEDLFRVGGDLIYGRVGHSDLWLRDSPTGQLYRGIEGEARGFAFVAGADFTQVQSSAYLLESMGYFPTDTRVRARAGIHWQMAPQTSFFYGATWLSEEFVGQPEGQILGSLKLNFNF